MLRRCCKELNKLENKLNRFSRNEFTTQADSDVFSARFLLSEENRSRLVACMNKPLDTGLRLQNTKRENSHAAVLIALCTNEQQSDEVSILYTRRSVQLSRHVRQISFPGGLKDPTDANYTDCALRETEEEIGLPRDRVEIWGNGALLNIPQMSAITPVFGVVRNLDVDQLTLNQQEVEEAFLVPIRDLASPDNVRHTQFKTGFSAPVFAIQQKKIWGITAYLTHNFLKCFLPAEVYNKNNAFKYVTAHPSQKKRF